MAIPQIWGLGTVGPSHTVEHYTKGEVKEVEDGATVQGLSEDAVHMKVNSGSKIRNLMGFAIKKIKEPTTKQVTWNGQGSGVTKTISCAEIMKRKVKGLHQVTSVKYKRIEEYWDPKEEGLERLKVNRDVPAITILLSKTPLDEKIPGYQAPGSFDAFWKKMADKDSQSDTRRKNQKKQNRAKSAANNDNSKIEVRNPKKQKRQFQNTSGTHKPVKKDNKDGEKSEKSEDMASTK